MSFNRREFIKRTALAGAAVALPWGLQRNALAQAAATPQIPLPASAIPQFVDPLPGLADLDAMVAVADQEIVLRMREFDAQPLPTGTFVPGVVPKTRVWGYLPDGKTSRDTYLGPVIIATRGVPTQMRLINELGHTDDSQLLAWKNSTDQTLAWADPNNKELNACAAQAQLNAPGTPPVGTCAQNYRGLIPACVHIHGGEVPAGLDGGPDAWYTSDGSRVGHGFYSKGFLGFFGEFPPVAEKGATFFLRVNAEQGQADPTGMYESDGEEWKRKHVGEAVYRFPNSMEPAPVWFHDHTLGATRLNVYAGLAGAHIIVDPDDRSDLPELVPLVIQDRMFDTNGQLYFPAGVPFTPNPDHPFWVPEFIGDVICVNGKAWPYLEVKQKRYQFILINGSNARTYEMNIAASTGVNLQFYQIGTDGGYLDKPVLLTKLVLMPGERATIIADFANLPAGATAILKNTARAPYPAGATVNGRTTGRIMQFRVTGPAVDTSYNPALPTAPPLRSPMVRLVNPATGQPAVPYQKRRQLTLNEVMGMPVTVAGVAYPGGPLEILLNNTKYNGDSARNDAGGFRDFQPVNENGLISYYSELPQEGQTELWEIINLTADAHPMHTHLTQFQIVSRQAFDVNKYLGEYAVAFGGAIKDGFGPPKDYNVLNSDLAVGGNPGVSTFLKGKSNPVPANEAGWKDTVRAMPGEVTRILVRYAPTDTPASVAPADAYFPFDPSATHGYVWHCHIVDHEDNEMMRPLQVQANPNAVRSYVKGRDY